MILHNDHIQEQSDRNDEICRCFDLYAKAQQLQMCDLFRREHCCHLQQKIQSYWIFIALCYVQDYYHGETELKLFQ